jgi:cytochrome c5
MPSLAMMLRLSTLFALALLLSACGDPGENDAKTPEMPRFSQPESSNGRNIWMGTCRNCHLLGIAGAPAVTDTAAWRPRIAKGQAALYQSALNGVKDDSGTVRMPARGGNQRLSDQQVRRAVDYMLAAVQHFSTPANTPQQ